jgi:hypothetical protein
MSSMAQALVSTGFLPASIKSPEQALAIIMTGRELGIQPMQAFSTINVIQGKPSVSPQLMLALINRSGQLEDMKLDTGATGATCMMKRRGRQPFTARFGPDEARAMGLADKANYKSQAPTMYQWRAVAAAARAVFPDVVLGLYTPEEMGAEVRVTPEGEMFVEETPGTPPAPAPPAGNVEVVGATVSGDDPETLKAKARDLCSAMNEGGYQPKWTATTLKTFLSHWYQAESLDAMSARDLKKLVADFEKKYAALQSEGDAERGLAGSRAKSAVNRAAGAQEGAAS